MNSKTTTLAAMVFFAAAGIARADETNSPFKNDREKTSYAIGVNIGSNWKQQEVDVDYDSFLRGLKDSSSDKKLLTDPEVQATLDKYRQEMMAKQQEKHRLMSEKNKLEGAAFLSENKNKPGVVTTASGLQYKILAEGSGDLAKPDDTVTFNFRGTLLDGTEFDSSTKSGKPSSSRVSGISLRGLAEALQLMKPGGKWQLYIPADLGYGEFGRRPTVGPNAVLQFEVELTSVQPAPPRAPLTSDIIKVPSVEEMKKGAKIETIKAEDLEKIQKQEQDQKKK